MNDIRLFNNIIDKHNNLVDMHQDLVRSTKNGFDHYQMHLVDKVDKGSVLSSATSEFMDWFITILPIVLIGLVLLMMFTKAEDYPSFDVISESLTNFTDKIRTNVISHLDY